MRAGDGSGFALRVGGWLAVALLATWLIAARLQITVDLAYFLPAPTTEQEAVLVNRLGQGPGSRLIFISLAAGENTDLDALVEDVRASLKQTGLFTRVTNGQLDSDIVDIPATIWRNRYLLVDIDTSDVGLRDAVHARLADLAVLTDHDATRLFAADPYLASLTVLEQLAGPALSGAADWVSDDGATAYLIAETHAPAFDGNAQQAAVRTIRKFVADMGGRDLELYGVGVYGAELQATIKSEARFRSLLASIAIALVLLLAYRDWRVLLIGGVPLMLGGVAGLATVAALFGKVHGITLAFGFTLFGVAIDYPLHVISHLRGNSPSSRTNLIWPTLRLGAFSTVVAYLAIAGAGSVGLAQLGCFSAVGTLVALWATRTLVPGLIDRYGRLTVPTAVPKRATMNPTHAIWVIGLMVGAGLLIVRPAPIWTNDLSSLTPISAERLERDSELRMALSAPDIRHLLIVRNTDRQKVLERTEALAERLAQAARDGIIDHAQSVTTLLPSATTQRERREQLGATTEWPARIARAIADTPFRIDAFAPFGQDVARTVGDAALITSDDYRDTSLETLVTGGLYFDGEQWVSVVTLSGLRDIATLRAIAITDAPDVSLVDLKDASLSLVERYRSRALFVLMIAFAVIGALLVWQIGLTGRSLWILGTLSTAILLTTGLTAQFLGTLSLFNLVATVLVAGLGLDYCLFLSRRNSDAADARDTRHAIHACVASTLAAFTVLAFSSVPVLHSIGLTVAVGVSVNYLLARFGLRSAERRYR
jgi:predicted exporter